MELSFAMLATQRQRTGPRACRVQREATRRRRGASNVRYALRGHCQQPGALRRHRASVSLASRGRPERSAWRAVRGRSRIRWGARRVSMCVPPTQTLLRAASPSPTAGAMPGTRDQTEELAWRARPANTRLPTDRWLVRSARLPNTHTQAPQCKSCFAQHRA